MSDWLPMTAAPKDGTPIIALYKDLSGVEMIRWGVEEKGDKEGWFEADWADTAFSGWAGWVPCPSFPVAAVLKTLADLRGGQ